MPFFYNFVIGIQSNYTMKLREIFQKKDDSPELKRGEKKSLSELRLSLCPNLNILHTQIIRITSNGCGRYWTWM